MLVYESSLLRDHSDRMRYCITIVSPHSTAYFQQAAKHGGSSAKVAVSRKVAKDNSACHNKGVHFIPVGFDAYGAIELDTRKLLQTVSQHLGSRDGTSPADEFR